MIGSKLTDKQIADLGWLKVPDRGMSENNGSLFYNKNNWVLRFWRTYPRFELSYKNSVAYDSAIADYDNFGPGRKNASLEDLKLIMSKHGIEVQDQVPEEGHSEGRIVGDLQEG
jgi:hypothetical protein